MPAPSSPCLYGPDDRPIRSSGGRFLSASDNSGFNRPSYPIRNDNINRLVPNWEHRTMVAISERLVCNHDVIDGAIWSKNQFSFSGAWEPRFLGEAKDWGKLATDFLLKEFYEIGDLKGPMHDAQTNLTIDGATIDRSGDFGILLTDFDGGYPCTQRISPWRIGQPGTGADGLVSTLRILKLPNGTPASDNGEVVEFKLAKALRMEKGIIYGPSGRPLYYRVMMDEPGALQKSTDWEDVLFTDFIHVYDPTFHDQGRGWPSCYASLCALRDSLTSREWEQLAMLIMSSISLIEYNETGTQQRDAGDPTRLTNPDSNDPELPFAAESFYGGLYRYFRANSGAKLEQLVSSRPGNPWRDFRDDINEGALRGINWSPLLAWGRNNPGGQRARAEIVQCRVSVQDRQKVMFYPTRRRDGYAISKAIKIKRLPPYPGKDLGGQFMWGYRLPAKISIDDGRDDQNRRANLILGSRNLDDVLAEMGDPARDVDEFFFTRARIAGRREQIRQQVEKEMGVPIDPRDMWQPNPNEQPNGTVGPGGEGDDEDTDDKPSKKNTDEK